MTAPAEREAIVSIMWEAAGTYDFRRGAERIIAEHIAPLRSFLEAERDKVRSENAQLVSDYGERGDLLAECRVRASALEAKRDELEAAFQDAMASRNRWRDDAHAAESRASALEAKRDEARLAYGEAIETQRIFVARASALEAEHDKARADCAQLVADYGERGDLLAECRVRVSALEALLAEVEKALKPLAAQELVSEMSEDKSTADFEGAYDTMVEIARSVLAKIKARTAEGGDA